MQRRPRQLATIALLLCSFLFSPATAAAQGGTGDWSHLTSVATGSKLSVKLRNGKTVDGTLQSVSDAALSLTVKNNPMEVKREDVLTVHQITKKSATKATLIGMGVGAGAGAIIGAANDSRNDSFETIDNVATGVVTVLGAGAGALAGFLVGRSGKKRVLVYEAK
jgi:small nuclear ribonucleoprotein (snRNP)-like protein